MTLQARFSPGDHRLYNPNRDVAHIFPYIVRAVAKRLSEKVWTAVEDVLAKFGVTQDQLGQAAAAFCNFVISSRDPSLDMEACLKASGWFDVPEPAQVGYQATLGCVMSGVFFAGVREASAVGDNPLLGHEGLIKFGAECAALMTEKGKVPT